MNLADRPDKIVVPRPCACGHAHHGHTDTLARVPACPTCGCDTFVIDPAHLAAADAEDAADAAAYPGGRLLDGEIYAGVHHTLRAFEDQSLTGLGWDCPPIIGPLYIGQPQSAGNGTSLLPVVPGVIDLSRGKLLEMTRGDADIIAALLADMAEERPELFDFMRVASDLDPRHPPVAWFCIYEAWAKDSPGAGSAQDDPSLRRDEIRQLVAVDVDERVHEITRVRSTGEVRDHVTPMHVYRARLAGGAGPDGMRVLADPTALPPLIGNLLRLVRVTRAEQDIRRAFPGNA